MVMLKNDGLDSFLEIIDSSILNVKVDKSNYKQYLSTIKKALNDLYKEVRNNILNLDKSTQIIYLKDILSELYERRNVILYTEQDIEEHLKEIESLMSLTNESEIQWYPLADEKERLQSLARYRSKVLADLPFATINDAMIESFTTSDWRWFKREELSYTVMAAWENILKHLKPRLNSVELDKLHWHWSINSRMYKNNGLTVDDTADELLNKELLVEYPGSKAPLKWLGTGVELAALFVELDRCGYVQLPSSNNFNRTSWEAICKAILGVFSLSTTRKKSTGEPWYTLSRYFVSRNENKKTGELEYSKLVHARRKFRNITPRNLTLDDDA